MEMDWSQIADEMYRWIADQPDEPPLAVTEFHEVTENTYGFEEEESEELLDFVLRTRVVYVWEDAYGNRYLSTSNPAHRPWYEESSDDQAHRQNDPIQESSSEEEQNDIGAEEEESSEDEEKRRKKEDKQRRRESGEQVSSDEDDDQLREQFSRM